MKISTTLTFVTITTILLLTGFNATAANLDYKDNKKLQLDADDLNHLDIIAGAGFLTVEGDDDIENIEVLAELKVNRENYELTLEKQGEKAVLMANANKNNRSNWFGDSPKIDLTVKLPKAFSLKIKDGSGLIKVFNIEKNIKINDGSGKIIADNLLGNVTIKDGSGGIKLSNVKGFLKINDGSGKIIVNHIDNDVEIDDGSGYLEVTDVKGKVSLEDGSGSILVKRVSGHVTIDDGSGSIDVELLEDGLTIVEAGSGGLSIKDVKGKVVNHDD